ncbi:MAG: hypothetical protein JXR96_11670 [Deltaproteobacteria bacterium]|nr:hypothetical protein [Deltaproteobacteria bacterium]
MLAAVETIATKLTSRKVGTSSPEEAARKAELARKDGIEKGNQVESGP